MTENTSLLHDLAIALLHFGEFLGGITIYLLIGMAIQFAIIQAKKKWFNPYKENDYDLMVFLMGTTFWPLVITIGPIGIAFVLIMRLIEKVTEVDIS